MKVLDVGVTLLELDDGEYREETRATGSNRFFGALWFRISAVYSIFADGSAPRSRGKQLHEPNAA
jgi:hypothetical protein